MPSFPFLLVQKEEVKQLSVYPPGMITFHERSFFLHFVKRCNKTHVVFCLIYSKEQLSDYSRCSVKYQFNAGKFSCQYFTVIRQRVMT